MTDTPKPLPCPFCGVDPFVAWEPGEQMVIRCVNSRCPIQVSSGWISEAEAIAAWNRRVVPTETPTAMREMAANLLAAADALDGVKHRKQEGYLCRRSHD